MRTERLTSHGLAKKLGAKCVEIIYSIEVSKFDDTDWQAKSGNATAFGSSRLEAIQELFEADKDLQIYFELNFDDNE